MLPGVTSPPASPDQQPLLPSSAPASHPVALASDNFPPPVHGGPADTGTDADEGPGMGALFVALRRRWITALAIGLCGALATAAAASYLVPTPVTVRTLLHVSTTRPALMSDTAEGAADFASYQRAQLGMVKSRAVLSRALQKVDSAGLSELRKQADPILWLEKQIQGDFQIAPETMRISMKGNPPGELKTLLNALRDAYLEEAAKKEQAERLARLEQLKQLAQRYDETFRGRRQKLCDRAEALGARDFATLKQQNQAAFAQLSTLQSERLQLQSQLRRLRLESEAQRDGPLEPEPNQVEAALEAQLKIDPAVATLYGEIARLQNNIARFKSVSVAVESVPTYRNAVAALKATEQVLAERRAALRSQLLARLRDKARLDWQANLAQQQQTITLMEKESRLRREEIQRTQQEADAVAKGILELDRQQDEVVQAEEVARKVRARVQALQVENQAPQRVSPLEDASIEPSSGLNRKLKVVVLPALGVFTFALLGIAWLEFRTGRVNGVEKVAQKLGRNRVGALPEVPDRVRQSLAPSGGPRDLRLYALWNDAVDATRALLVPSGREGTPRLVLVTSALSGESKSSLAMHLALSLARAGHRTLLVDANLRSPRLHQLFAPTPQPGFGELLRGTAELAAVVRSGSVEGLSVVPIGQCGSQTAATLAPGRVATIFRQFNEAYEFVIVDTAPALPVPDTLLMGPHADGVILSVLRDVSRLPAVQAALERLTLLKSRILGVVVSGVRGTGYGAF